MTLSDVHDNPELLADLLQVPFEDATETRLPAYGYPYRTGATVHTVTAAERVTRAYAEYRAANELAWSRSAANPYREQTWGQFLAECLREGLGVRKAGKLADRLTYATMARPDIYRPADGETLQERMAREKAPAAPDLELHRFPTFAVLTPLTDSGLRWVTRHLPYGRRAGGSVNVDPQDVDRATELAHAYGLAIAEPTAA